jgi:hypothetical protein
MPSPLALTTVYGSIIRIPRLSGFVIDVIVQSDSHAGIERGLNVPVFILDFIDRNGIMKNRREVK